jgi:hypothetical protein
VILLSCEKTSVIDTGPDSKIDPDVLFRIGDGTEYHYDDIALYDSSAHILYFRKEQDKFYEIINKPFAFLNRGDTIYSGLFWPGYYSSIPVGPVIMSPPSMYGNYALRIQIWLGDKSQLINNPELIDVLKDHGLLHSGLEGRIDKISFSETKITFRFTITNRDKTDLLILDINKTGPNLFHYFTNGLSIRNPSHDRIYESTIQHSKPEPWNSFKTEWLSLLKSGESASFEIEYPVEDPINPGEYYAIFEFPGLAYQVSKNQLFQGMNRIWLGDITLRKEIILK